MPRKVVPKGELGKLKAKVLKDKTRTILEPGQLDQLRETGKWRLNRIKKSKESKLRNHEVESHRDDLLSQLLSVKE